MGFEPMKRFWRLRALQARAFDHSAISPKIEAVKIHFFSIGTPLCKKKIILPEIVQPDTLFCIFAAY